MKLALFLLLCLVETANPMITIQEFYRGFKRLFEKYLTTGENFVNTVFTNDTSNCLKDLSIIYQAVKRKDHWAIQLLDSYGKFIESYIWPGTESLCLSIVPEVNTVDGKIQPFETQYCTLRLLMLSIGACLPTTCTEKYVNGLFTIFREFTGKFQLVQLRCVSEDSRYLEDGFALFCILFCLILLLIMISGTIYDVLLRLHIKWEIEISQQDVPLQELPTPTYTSCNGVKHIFEICETEKVPEDNVQVIKCKSMVKRTHKKILTNLEQHHIFEKRLQEEISTLGWLGHFLFSFSVFTNIKKLFDVTFNDGQIPCLDGLRVISILTVVYGHIWFFSLTFVENIVALADLSGTFGFHLIVHMAPFSVDTFFLMSGLLSSYVHLKKLKIKRATSWFGFYWNRYFRLSPSYWFVTYILYFGLFLREKFGPLDLSREYGIKTCKENWWLSLLYVSNSQPLNKECYAIEWYISAEMQFFWLSPILLYLMVNYERLAIGLASLTVVASSITTFLLAKDKNVNISLPKDAAIAMGTMRGLGHYLEDIYIKPYCRITPYIFGLMVGWLLFKTGRCIKFKKIQIVLLWCLAIFCLAVAAMTPYYFNLSGITSSIYLSVMYILWSVTASILIILCATGNGGIMNSFLSWSGWFPFARLAFGVYLLHPIVIYYFHYKSERSPYLGFDMFNMYFLCVIISCFAFSTYLHLTVESPFQNLTNKKRSLNKSPVKEIQSNFRPEEK